MEIEVGGQIQGISLGSFLQIVHMDKTSCTLKIYSNDDVGYLYLQDGALVAAEAGELDNVEAAYEILSWNKTVIIIDNAPVPDQNISVPIMSILMEGLRRKDEKNARLEAESVTRKELDVEFDPETYVSKDDQIASQFVVGEEKEPEKEAVAEEAPEEKAAMDEPPAETAAEEDAGESEERGTPAMDTEEVMAFEGEDELPGRNLKGLFVKTLLATVILGSITFGGLTGYQMYLEKKSHEQTISHIKSQKNLKKMKKVLSTYLGRKADDSDYIPDAVAKMNQLESLMEVEKKVASLPLDDEYKGKATQLYSDYLAENKGTFLEEYVNDKLTMIPRIIEQNDFKKLSVISGLDRETRYKKYNEFIKNYPKSKHKQTVMNMIAAVGDEYYLDLVKEIANCNKNNNWGNCIDLADSFVETFANDKRVESILEVKKKMQDRAEYADMKFRATGMSYDDAKKMYIAYLKNNAHSSLKNEIRDEISLLNRKIDFQAKWEETYAYCTNPDIELYHRMKELNDYMERDYSGLFRKESEALMARLEEEKRVGRQKMLQLQKERQEKERLAKIEAEKKRIAEEKERIRLAKIKREEKEARLKKESERFSVLLAQSGGRFILNKDRTVTDTRTGLVWVMIDSFLDEGECMTYQNAGAYVKRLTVGGYKDWRLPDTGELAVIYNSKPYFPSSGAAWYWTSDTHDRSWAGGEKAAVFYPDKKTEFKKVFVDYNKCGYIHAVRP